MTAKRFILYEHKDNDYILDNPNVHLDFIEMLGDALTSEEIVDKLNELNEENIRLKRDFDSCSHNWALMYDEAKEKVEALTKENWELKQELKVYRKVASCSNCKYHNYDWDINDGYGGEEYEVCDKRNDVTNGICEEWEEL